jgi:hypothetical protein
VREEEEVTVVVCDAVPESVVLMEPVNVAEAVVVGVGGGVIVGVNVRLLVMETVRDWPETELERVRLPVNVWDAVSGSGWVTLSEDVALSVGDDEIVGVSCDTDPDEEMVTNWLYELLAARVVVEVSVGGGVMVTVLEGDGGGVMVTVLEPDTDIGMESDTEVLWVIVWVHVLPSRDAAVTSVGVIRYP